MKACTRGREWKDKVFSHIKQLSSKSNVSNGDSLTNNYRMALDVSCSYMISIYLWSLNMNYHKNSYIIF